MARRHRFDIVGGGLARLTRPEAPVEMSHKRSGHAQVERLTSLAQSIAGDEQRLLRHGIPRDVTHAFLLSSQSGSSQLQHNGAPQVAPQDVRRGTRRDPNVVDAAAVETRVVQVHLERAIHRAAGPRAEAAGPGKGLELREGFAAPHLGGRRHRLRPQVASWARAVSGGSASQLGDRSPRELTPLAARQRGQLGEQSRAPSRRPTA